MKLILRSGSFNYKTSMIYKTCTNKEMFYNVSSLLLQLVEFVIQTYLFVKSRHSTFVPYVDDLCAIVCMKG